MQLRSRDALIICLEASGMSERQLARVAGLGHATVNHLVTGRRTRCSPATAFAIETALGCEYGTLFDGPRPTDAQWRRFGGHSRRPKQLRGPSLVTNRD
ncbi:MAG: helix-turn-helix transcriptional regulator [Jatrophihabitantaceae bacterium]